MCSNLSLTTQINDQTDKCKTVYVLKMSVEKSVAKIVHPVVDRLLRHVLRMRCVVGSLWVEC